MIINSKRRIIYFVAAIPLSILVACLFTTGAYVFKVHPAPFELTAFVELLCGIFFAVAIGMLFNEDSRINGLIYAIAVSVVTYFYMISPGVNIDLLQMMCSIGLIIGIFFVLSTVFKNRFDNLVIVAKIILTLIFLTIIGFLSYEILLAITDTTYALALQSFFFFGAGILLAIALYKIAMKITVGVRASEIFVIGPRSSGKTYFVLGLWHYIIRQNGHTNDGIVLTGDPNDKGDALKISSMYEKVKLHQVLPRTFTYQMVIYEFYGKKFGIIPVKWTVVDYAGEYCNELNDEKFNNAISKLSESMDMNLEEVRRKAGTGEFVEEIKRSHADKLLSDPEFTKSVIIATMYGNFLKAGKVIFLVDGEKIADTKKGHAQLAREFGGYINTLINDLHRNSSSYFKSTKKYAFVVTKTDLVFWKNGAIRRKVNSENDDKLSDVPENSQQALAIENSLYEILEMNDAFMNIKNMIDDLSMHFIAVSVDASSEPLPVEEGTENEIVPTNLAPWGFSRIFKFGQ
ncbi:MAG: hypothetical protein J5928_03190 [Firmicutes bacterium]|nr:hypothetical protein [Bacillota bacterium]